MCAETGYNYVKVKIDCKNEKSLGLFKKLGAVIDFEDDIFYCHLDLPLKE